MADFRISGIIEVDASRAIRDLTKFQNKVKGLNKDIATLAGALKKIDGTKIDIDLAAEKAKRDAAELRRDIAEIAKQKATAKLDVDSQLAELKIEKFKTDLETANAKAAQIKVDIDAKNALREANQLKRDIDSITKSSAQVKVEMKGTQKAISEAAALNAELDAMLDDKTIDIDVKTNRRGLDSLREAIEDVDFSLGSPGGGGMIGAIALLATTLAPLSGVAAGAAGGMVSSFGIMGGAVASFGLFAIPAIKDLAGSIKLLSVNTDELSPDKLKKHNEAIAEMKKNNPDIWKAAQAFNRLKDAYVGYAEQIKPEIIRSFGHLMEAAGTGVDYLGRVAVATAPAITDLMKSLKENMKADDVSKFFKYMEENAAGFTTVWGKTVGNFIVGLQNMIVAFDPITKMVNSGFLSMSENFRKWSAGLGENEGFKRFTDYVVANGPKIWKGLKDIGEALIRVGIALAPLGMAVFDFITKLANMWNEFQKGNPEMASTITSFGLVGVALAPFAGLIGGILGPLGGLFKGLAKIAKGPLGKIITKFPMLGKVIAIATGPIGIVAGLLTAIGLGLALSNNKTSEAEGMWNKFKDTWEKVKETGTKVKDMFVKMWEILKNSGAIENFQKAFGDLATAFGNLLPVLEPVAFILGGALLVAIMAFSDALAIVATTLEKITAVVGWFAREIVAEFQYIYDVLVGHSIIPDLVNGIITWFSKLPLMIPKLIAQMVTAGIKKLSEFATGALNKARQAKDWVVGKFTELKDRAGQVWENAKTYLGGKFSAITEKARSMGTNVKTYVSTKFGEAKSKLSTITEGMRSAAVTKFQGIINGARDKLGNIKSTVTGAFSGAAGWLTSAGGKIVRGLAEGIGNAFHYVTGKLSSLASKISGYFPFSPVKEGPLRAWNDGSPGKNLMKMLAGGIRSDSTVENAVRRIADEVARVPMNAAGQISSSIGSIGSNVGNMGANGNASLPTGTVASGGGNYYKIEVNAPVGSSSIEIGKEIMRHVDAYERAGGRRSK